MNITAKMVKELRDKTNAGMMECKKALQEANGIVNEAIKILRKKGMKKAQSKAGRTTKQGIIYSYIHPGAKVGVLLELNCETDFVAKNQGFAELAKNVAMQIAAQKPIAISKDYVDPKILEEEKEIYIAQAKDSGKPEQIIEKIVQGKINKFLSENCLLSQPFIKDETKTIDQLIKEYIVKYGENISVARFARYELGEE
ncbi:MAG: elongation factor Ts [Candidatus Cloacimonadota bacterium]|nr:MAG: elongation factor Ts [Candidatus Cloacimonadota bacterium]